MLLTLKASFFFARLRRARSRESRIRACAPAHGHTGAHATRRNAPPPGTPQASVLLRVAAPMRAPHTSHSLFLRTPAAVRIQRVQASTRSRGRAAERTPPRNPSHLSALAWAASNARTRPVHPMCAKRKSMSWLVQMAEATRLT